MKYGVLLLNQAILLPCDLPLTFRMMICRYTLVIMTAYSCSVHMLRAPIDCDPWDCKSK